MDVTDPVGWVRNAYGLVVPNPSPPISAYGVWTSGQAIDVDGTEAQRRRYDDHDGNDYEALVDISAGDNTIRPSEAVISTDEAIAARWALVDVSNANRLFDAAQRIQCTEASPMAITVRSAGLANSLTFAALSDTIDSISVTITQSGLSPITLSAPSLSGERVVRFVHPDRFMAYYAITLTGTGTLGVGEIDVGYRRVLGTAEAGIQHDMIDYSVREWDDDYGTYRYTKRGYSRILRGTVHIPDRLGDWVDRVTSARRAEPSVWDFNDAPGLLWPGTSESSRILYGIPTQRQRIDNAIEHIDTLALEITGLVEND
jgi:hypothetical protein